jgi:hypothetical protein
MKYFFAVALLATSLLRKLRNQKPTYRRNQGHSHRSKWQSRGWWDCLCGPAVPHV